MTSFLDWKVWVAVLAALIIGALGAGIPAYNHAVTITDAKWQGEQAKWNAQRLAENKEMQDKFDREKEEFRKGINNEIQTVRNNAVAAATRGLRVNSDICADRKTSAEGSTGSNAGASSTFLLPEPYAGNLIRLMVEADEAIATCRGLQDFVRKNKMD